MKRAVLVILMAAPLNVSAADFSPAVLKEARQFKDTCVKYIDRPKVRAERIEVCGCIARRLADKLTPADLKIVTASYKPGAKEIDPDENAAAAAIADYESQISKECFTDAARVAASHRE
jgi:hypothetical protein